MFPYVSFMTARAMLDRMAADRVAADVVEGRVPFRRASACRFSPLLSSLSGSPVAAGESPDAISDKSDESTGETVDVRKVFGELRNV